MLPGRARPHRPSETERATRRVQDDHAEPLSALRPLSASTRPGAPLTPLHTGSHIHATPRPGQTGALSPGRGPPCPPHAALPTMSRSLRPHPGLWPLPASSSSGSPPGPRAQFGALSGRHQVPKLWTPKLWPQPCYSLPHSSPRCPLTLHNSEPLALADQVPHSPHNSPVSMPAPRPTALNSSPLRAPAGSPWYRSLCRRQYPDSPQLSSHPSNKYRAISAATAGSSAPPPQTPHLGELPTPHSVLLYLL